MASLSAMILFDRPRATPRKTSIYSALAEPARLLSEFGGVGGYSHTSSEQPCVDRVCSWSKARIRGRGQENDPDLDSIRVPNLGRVEEDRYDRYSADDWRQTTQQDETE